MQWEGSSSFGRRAIPPTSAPSPLADPSMLPQPPVRDLPEPNQFAGSFEPRGQELIEVDSGGNAAPPVIQAVP